MVEKQKSGKKDRAVERSGTCEGNTLKSRNERRQRNGTTKVRACEDDGSEVEVARKCSKERRYARPTSPSLTSASLQSIPSPGVSVCDAFSCSNISICGEAK